MKKQIFLFQLLFLIITSSVNSQSLMDYIAGQKGDTLVVKDYHDMGDQPNSLYWALTLDTDNVPSGRVYELKANGYYPLTKNPTTIRNTIIVGEDNTILVNNENASSHPPLICGATGSGEYGNNTGGINFMHDLTVKNCIIVLATENGYSGLIFFYGQADRVKLTLENCLIERTLWAFTVTYNKDISWHFKDCYFVNMSGKWHRRSGGVFHVFAPQDTLLVENCTHIMASGYLYRFWQFPFKRIIFNHNTFINCAGVIFQDFGYQSASSTTNNIFVNCNVQPYCDVLASWDVSEFDPDTLAIGLVNVHALPDSFVQLDRKYLFKNNVVYWDPKLGDIVSTLNETNVNGVNDWTDQMVIMNERTQAMFDDNESYPYLTEGKLYQELPNFSDSQDLLTTQLDSVKAYVIAIVDTNGARPLPTWRLVNTGQEDYVHPDWPIPVDLSYNNAELLTGAINGFPVGDLNWFPDKKVQWNAQRKSEYDSIEYQLGSTVVNVVGKSNLVNGFKLQQNYPNPFNPSTTINYDLPKQSKVKMVVYDILGREVTTLVDEPKKAGSYQVRWNASRFASGLYFCRIQAGDYIATKKLVLLK